MSEGSSVSQTAIAIVNAAHEARWRTEEMRRQKEADRSNFTMFSNRAAPAVQPMSVFVPPLVQPITPMARMFGDACGKILLLLMNADSEATKLLISKWLLHSHHISQLLEQTKKFPLVQVMYTI